MLRELKKQQTRQAISDVATRLFIEHGFDEVTIAQVAAAAEVAKMTVTNHFPRKEDLVFDVHEEFAARLAARVSPPVVETAREAYFEALARHDALLGFSGRDFAHMIVSSPVLLARLREMHDEQEATLAASLASDLDGVTAKAAAAQIAGAHRLLFHEVLRRTAGGQRTATIVKALEPEARRVFELLESGLGAVA
ncbi:TetR/AcrR family transcriptional regulator [Amycolatopsis acidicola]|nr:TetR/AcrR family transcriptional regulator [Amycolatopsis acidicola]